MKLERAHEYITTTVAIVVGITMALVFGRYAGEGRFGMVGVALGLVAFVAVLLALRENVWILIPVATQLGGQIEQLPGHPAIKDVAILLVFSGVFALTAFKVIRRKLKYTAVDFWMGFMLLYLLTVYVRNPVGGEALGSERVGGRPYLNIFVATLAYWVLSRVTLPPKFAKAAYKYSVILALSASIGTLLQIYIPATSIVLGPIFGEAKDESEKSTDPGELTRAMFLAAPGSTITLALVAAYPPLSLLNPARVLRFTSFFAGLILILLSGFRSMLVFCAATFVISTHLRGGVSKLLKVAVPGSFAILVLVLMQGTFFNLPLSVQRTLSFLPGDWDRSALDDARFSSQWRFHMWELMLTTDRYIENKVLGDGFGMTKLQYQQASTTAANVADPAQMQETFMISGTVHSGPIGAIKFVGYVGLAIFLSLLGVLARASWRLCRRAKGTPYYPYVLYVGIPLIFAPLNFVFIFGALDSDLAASLVSGGMLKLLENSMDRYERELEEENDTREQLATQARPLALHLQY